MVDTNRLIYPIEWVGIGLVSGIAYVLAKYALKERSFEAEKKNCGCGKDPCITYGAEPCSNYVAESFEAEPLKITGLEKLTNEQLSNLEEWVNKYIHKSIDEIEAINDDVAYRIERLLGSHEEDLDWYDTPEEWMEEYEVSNELGQFLLSPTDDDTIGGWADEDILISERWDKLNPQIKLLILISVSKQMNRDKPPQELTNEEKNFINQLIRKDDFIYDDEIVSIATKRKIESWLDDNYYHSPNEPIIYDNIGGSKIMIVMYKNKFGGAMMPVDIEEFLYDYIDEDTDSLDINLVREEGEDKPIIYDEENSYLFRFLQNLENKSKTELQYIAANRDLSQRGTKKFLRTNIAIDIFLNELALGTVEGEKYINSVRNFINIQNDYSPDDWDFDNEPLDEIMASRWMGPQEE